MKYIKKFNEGNLVNIEFWIDYFKLRDYTINENGIVDVNFDVNISWKKLQKIPIQFGIVSESFDCGNNLLITLEGSPIETKRSFFCDHNKLESLKNSPKKVSEHFNCSSNNLISLEGGPKIIGSFNGRWNLYNCRSNNLISLEGLPDGIISGGLDCSGNPIWEIYKLFDCDYKKYGDSLDYNYLRGRNIIKLRFREALEEIGIMEIPESIPGYKYI